MIKEVDYKLDQIFNIWRNYINVYASCKKDLKIKSDTPNYLSAIEGYFRDSNDIIYSYSSSKTLSTRLSNQISLLQNIYIQQDFIEELLKIFNITHITKKELRNKDENYSKNRNLRNELIGHPISRSGKNKELNSFCLFGYDNPSDIITSLKYSKENDFKFKLEEHMISDIISRHYNFLICYFDEILKKLNTTLKKFKKEIEKFKKEIPDKNFEDVLTFVSSNFESIYNSHNLYSEDSLSIIYSKKSKHPRYSNFITFFLNDLNNHLDDKIIEIKEIGKSKFLEDKIHKKPIFTNTTRDSSPQSFNYELSKLADKDNIDITIFKSHISFFEEKFDNNQTVLEELNNMKLNFNNDNIEYFTSYELLCYELNKIIP